jgi:ABC-2 type transport system ATP-binding protein
VLDEHDLAIVAHSVGVRFQLDMSRRRTLRQATGELIHRRGKPKPFWALRDVSITVKSGEVIGVVGRNGSGKSTLLLVLAGILRPDSGIVRVFGKTSTLLTLGAGFQPELTGRENIYLSGAFLGQSRKEMDELLDSIIDFSGLGEFVDVPIRKYSAGMRARLGFSIASHVEPDILLLDEVLGVGDEEFKRRSRERIRQLVSRARSIVIVSHDLAFIESTCTRCVCLDEGTIAATGDPAEVVDFYRRMTHDSVPVRRTTTAAPEQSADLSGVRLRAEDAPVSLQTEDLTVLRVTVVNEGNSDLRNDSDTPLRLSYRIFDPAGARLVAQGHRAPLPPVLRYGESADLALQIVAPAVPGKYKLRVSVVQEFVAWLDDLFPDHGILIPLDVAAAGTGAAGSEQTASGR